MISRALDDSFLSSQSRGYMSMLLWAHYKFVFAVYQGPNFVVLSTGVAGGQDKAQYLA
jgi:hypothetical protein